MRALVAVLLASSAHAGTSALVLAQSAEARDVAQAVAAQLAKQGVGAQVSGAGRGCGELEGKPHLDCLADVAQTAWVDAVVVVSVAGTRDKSAVVLEAVGRKSRKLLLESSVSGTPEELDVLVRDAVAKIAGAIKASVRAIPAVKSPAPVPAPPSSPEVDAAFAAQDPTLVPKPEVEPAAPVPAAAAVTAPPPAKPKIAAWTATGVTIVSLGVAVAMGAVTMGERAQLSAANPITRISPYSYEQARQLRDTTNLHMGVAIGAGLVGIAGLGVTIALW